MGNLNKEHRVARLKRSAAIRPGMVMEGIHGNAFRVQARQGIIKRQEVKGVEDAWCHQGSVGTGGLPTTRGNELRRRGVMR